MDINIESDSGIPEELLELVEELAEHVHDKWIEEKTRQGWKYGDIRDDAKKTSPCMVSYMELSELQKNLIGLQQWKQLIS